VSDMKHTPGPWKWEGVSLVQVKTGHQILWPFNIPNCIEEDTPRHIKMGCAHTDTSNAAEANAALIASAPDMYAEIERLREMVAKCTISHTSLEKRPYTTDETIVEGAGNGWYVRCRDMYLSNGPNGWTDDLDESIAFKTHRMASVVVLGLCAAGDVPEVNLG